MAGNFIFDFSLNKKDDSFKHLQHLTREAVTTHSSDRHYCLAIMRSKYYALMATVSDFFMTR